ncbi:glycosyltransferase, partial [Nesterenkonia suensis]
MLRTAEHAHQLAASSWDPRADDARTAATGAQDLTKSPQPTEPLRRDRAQAHRLRAAEHRQRHEFLDQISTIAPSAVSALSAQDLTALSVPDTIGTAALHPPARCLQDALEASQGLPDGELGASRPKLSARIGLIASPRVHSRFTGLADVVPLTGGTWREHLEDLDLLLVSTDLGSLSHQWDQCADPCADPDAREHPGHPGQEGLGRPATSARRQGHRAENGGDAHTRALRHLAEVVIPAFRGGGTPTVLLSTAGTDISTTEELARACSRIVTTDPEAAALYRARENHSLSIDVVPVGVNPLIHSPLGTRPARTDLVALLGCEQSGPSDHLSEPPYAPALLDGALLSGRPVVLLQPDPSQAPAADHWVLPSRYGPWTVSAEEAADIDLTYGTETLQRGMDAALALNATVDSQSLFDPQVLELQACGTLVIATYNQGLNSYHPHTVIANSADDVAKALQLISLDELRRIQGDGIRQVFTDHHASDVLRRICARAGLDVAPVRERVVAVAQHRTPSLAREMAEQIHREVELITWAELAERVEERGAAAVAAELDVLLPVSPARRHSPTYVADHVVAFRYQSAHVTQKLEGDAAATDAASHRHRTGVLDLELTAWWRPDPELLTSAETLREAADRHRVYCLDHLGHHPASSGTRPTARPSFSDILRGEAREPSATPRTLPRTLPRRRGPAAGTPGPMSAQPPGPSGVRPRRPLPDPEVGDDLAAVQSQARRAAETLGLRLSVIVPVYNNGDHLRHKAFASLRRSSIFSQMHILLIDDGSTDP